ncbi:MAG TPA: cytochrome P460 family protein [Bryobacteraceae bacterium]|nr:cytochrome P460 family protein [Bryobacteraceae bacterium]
MKQRAWFACLVLTVVPAGFQPWLGDQPVGGVSRFVSGDRLVFPDEYRQWVWLSSGLGMSYEASAADKDPIFTNVFADPASYRAFEKTGHWPDGTTLVLEEREAVSHGSINRAGHYQGALRGIVVETREPSRSHGKWMFYNFGLSTKPVDAIPEWAQCYSCHAKNGAVDNTFVQFYPTLLEIARQKHTVR